MGKIKADAKREVKMASKDKQIIGLLEEEIAFTEDCPNDCPYIDAHAHKAGLKQLLALLKNKPKKKDEQIRKLLEESLRDSKVYGPMIFRGNPNFLIVSKYDYDQALALLKEQPEPATKYGFCLCCGEPFSKDESVYVGVVHTKCWHKLKEQTCKTCPEGE